MLLISFSVVLHEHFVVVLFLMSVPGFLVLFKGDGFMSSEERGEREDDDEQIDFHFLDYIVVIM